MRRAARALMSTLFALTAAAISAGTAQAQGAPPAPLYREIKQWIVGCDNTRLCTAKFVLSEFAPPAAMRGRVAGIMSITRMGGSVGLVTVRLSIQSEYDEDTQQKTLVRFDPARIQLDGLPLAPRLDPPRRTGLVSEHVVTGPAALQLIAALRGGSLLSITGRPDSPLVSLEGLPEALAAIDQAQGRTNNQSAFIHGAGAAPAAATPPAVGAPLVRARPATAPLPNAQALAAQVRRAKARVLRDHECDLRRSGDAASRLNERDMIVVLDCTGGPFQNQVLAFRAPIANPGAASLIRMPVPRFLRGGGGGDVAGEYGAGRYDAATATFSQVSYARAAGDCGMAAKWVFDGREFHLSELAYQDRCGGISQDWPVLFKSRVLELD